MQLAAEVRLPSVYPYREFTDIGRRGDRMRRREFIVVFAGSMIAAYAHAGELAKQRASGFSGNQRPRLWQTVRASKDFDKA